MKRVTVTFLAFLAIAAPALAEFTEAEKTQILRMQRFVDDARYLEFYAGEELRANQNPEAWPLAIALGQAAHAMESEAHHAVDWIVGSLATNIPSHRPLATSLVATKRVESAKFLWSRAANGYRNGQVRAALEALKPVAVTSGILIYSGRMLDRDIDPAYGQVDLESHSYEAREPAWWPFLVRRAADNIGVHGHFENATARIAEGYNYSSDISHFAWKGVENWNGVLTQAVRSGMRNLVLGHRDFLKRVAIVQLAAYGIGADAVGPNDFARLFATLQDAQVPVAQGLKGQLMFSLRNMLRDAMTTGQVATAEDFAEAVEKAGDGWGHVDGWNWEATRFPCITGFDSVGCRPQSEGGLGLPEEPLLPIP